MKKKVLLALLLVSLFICIFAVAVNAAGASTNAFGEITPIEGETAPAVIDSTSRVVIKASDDTYYTFPSYYILNDSATFTWKKNDKVNEIIGRSISSASDIRAYIVRMEIPEGVTQMNPNTSGGATVFEDAKIMVEATVPSSMEYIGAYAFQRCYELVTINGLKEHYAKATKVGPMVLNGTKWGEGIDLVFAEGLTSISNYSFKGTKINSVTFPSTLTNIDERAFQGCTNLTTVKIPAGMITIKNHVFADCTGLQTVDVSECTKITTIGNYCFEKCGLTSFDFTPFAKSLTTLGEGVFNNCGSCTSVSGYDLLDNITSVGNNMFNLCPLAEITFPKNITSIGGYAYFNHRSMQTEIRIPNGVTSIGNHAFVRDKGVTGVAGVKIYLPASLKTVSNNYTFEYWDFAEMYMPAGFDLPTGFVNGTNETGTVYYYTGALNGLTIDSTNNKALLNAEWVHVDNFKGADSTKNIIVYGCNLCDLFYKGEHDVKNAIEGSTCKGICSRVGCGKTLVLANAVHVNSWFFNDSKGNEMSLDCDIVATYMCTDCQTVERTENIEKIFDVRGYTFDEKNPNHIGHKTIVNLTAKATYEELSGKTIKYGMLAGIAPENADGQPISLNNDGEIVVGKSTIIADMTGTEFSLIEIKITNINLSTFIYCNAYAIIDSNITYICDSISDTATIKKIVIPVVG